MTAAADVATADHGQGTPTSGGPPARGRRVGGGARAAGLFLGVQAALMAAIAVWQPRFFYYDDLQVQYIPVWRWLGPQVGSGGLPLMDPDQGSGGALVADLQYGILDPVHWALAWVVAQVDDLNLVAWGLRTLVVLVLGLGTVALARALGARPVWAALAAVGAVNCGFLVWFASWWPAGWGTAWMPWLWWALVSRSRAAVPVAVLASYLLITSGYPYVLPFTGVMVLGVVGERLLRDRRVRGQGDLVVRLVAGAGGALLGASGLLTASALTPFSQRSQAPADPFGNAGQYIPNLLDVLSGGVTTSPSVVGWWGDRLPPAVLAFAWFVLPCLALVRWRGDGGPGAAWRAPGVPTAALLCAVAVVATQTPTIVADFRYPFRYVVVLGATLPLLVAVVASRRGLEITRSRLLVAGVLLAVQAGVGLSRTPALWKWHVLPAVVGVLVLAVLRWSARREGRDVPSARRGLARWAAPPVVLLLATAGAPLASIGTAISYADVDAVSAGRPVSGLPARGVYESGLWPSRASEFRALSQGVGLDATVMWWPGPGEDRGALEGVPVGSAGLLAGVSTGYSYTSLGQAGWAGRWCADIVGQLNACADPAASLLERVPGTTTSWLLAMSKDVVLLDDRAPDSIREGLAAEYDQVGEDRGFSRWERRDPTPGRVTWAGADVDSVRAVDVQADEERYDVVWSAGDSTRILTRIPWWPGYTATLDGRPLDVDVVEGTLVSVELPSAGGQGQLEIRYERPRAAAGFAAVGLGVVLSVGAVGAGVLLRRRRG